MAEKLGQTMGVWRVHSSSCSHHCEAADHSAVEAIARASSLRDGVPKRGRSNLHPRLRSLSRAREIASALRASQSRARDLLVRFLVMTEAPVASAIVWHVGLAMTMQLQLLCLRLERILAMTDASAEVVG